MVSEVEAHISASKCVTVAFSNKTKGNAQHKIGSSITITCHKDLISYDKR